jgi:hypothetical protein
MSERPEITRAEAAKVVEETAIKGCIKHETASFSFGNTTVVRGGET